MNKKITRATFKKFINDNKENLYFCSESNFNAMSDMVEQSDNPHFKKAILHDWQQIHTLGIQGVWLVNRSRDCFRPYTTKEYTGISVFNACGSFTLAIKL